jgi:hypothetical protein
MVQCQLKKKVGTKVIFPRWFDEVAERLYVDDLRVRRYYPAFIEACRTVCLIRSFQPDRKLSKHGQLVVDFADYAITALIFDSAFVESLHLAKGAGEATRRLVEEIAAREKRPVEAKDIMSELKTSKDKAYSKLRYAKQAGVICCQVNEPQRNNRKAYLSNPHPRFVPDPKKLFQKLKDLDKTVRFVHPLKGEWVIYKREK